MMLIAGNRETAKTGAQKSANREGTGEPTDGGPAVIGLTVEKPMTDHQMARLRLHQGRLCNAGGAQWTTSVAWT